MRQNSFTLPTSEELWHILAKESPRKAARLDYLAHHPHIFDNFTELCKLAGEPYEWTASWQFLALDPLVAAIDSCIKNLRSYILKNTIPDALALRLYNDLAIDVTTEAADAVFIFGAASNARVEKAIELYKDGYAPILIVSGKGPHYKDVTQAEADRMAQIAVEAGVPTKQIIIENQSITIPDNVKRTIDLLLKMDFKPKKLLLVASGYVLQRAAMDWYKFTPWDIQLMPTSATVVSPDYSKDGWHHSAVGISSILNEYAKIIIENKMDQLRANEEYSKVN